MRYIVSVYYSYLIMWRFHAYIA